MSSGPYRTNPANRQREDNLRREVEKELKNRHEGETFSVDADNPRGRGDRMSATKRGEGYEINNWGTKPKE